jgi:hypothetical protein
VELDDIFRAIRNDKPYNEAENGALSSMTAIMGRMATYTGKRVSWDAAYNSTDSITTDAETWDATAPILPKEDGFYPVAMPGVTKLV